MKKEAAFFRERRRDPWGDVVKFMRDMGMTNAEIAEELRKIQQKQGQEDAAKEKAEPAGAR